MKPISAIALPVHTSRCSANTELYLHSSGFIRIVYRCMNTRNVNGRLLIV